MANQFMTKDNKLTNNIIEEEKTMGGTNVAAMSRKGEIMKLFKEVQETQHTLNENLLRELKAQIDEQNLILNSINASVSEFVERINKAICLKLE